MEAYPRQNSNKIQIGNCISFSFDLRNKHYIG
uniref:Uncharacterized protein n=1 Tax=Anguilla anguilla TaxID=7936 RepID=A0A0E9VLF9_ANGAN